MLTRGAALATAAIVAMSVSPVLGLQRGRQGNAGEKPQVDVVQSVGCAERRDGGSETWWLTRAADPTVTQPGIFNTRQIDAAKAVPPGGNEFQLVGVADFLDPEGLLRSGRRRDFTTPETANATGELRQGRRVLVKGLLVANNTVKRINLLAVIGLADTCG